MADRNDPPTPGWGVEITGHQFDIADWADELERPFDPWIERFERNGRETVALRSSAFDGVTTAAEARAIGSQMIEQVKGALLIVTGHRADIQQEASLYVDAHGKVQGHAFLRAEPGVFRMRASRATLTAYDGHGNIIPPPPPQPSMAQQWTRAGLAKDRLGELLVYLGRADNWFDLYKALEVAEELAGSGEEGLAAVTGTSLRKVKRLKQSANFYRHAGGRHKLPGKPVELNEARAQLQLMAKAILEKVT